MLYMELTFTDIKCKGNVTNVLNTKRINVNKNIKIIHLY